MFNFSEDNISGAYLIVWPDRMDQEEYGEMLDSISKEIWNRVPEVNYEWNDDKTDEPATIISYDETCKRIILDVFRERNIEYKEVA